MVVEKIILIIYIGIILYLGIWDITEQYMSHIIIFTSSIILCVWVLYSLKKLTKNNISEQLYSTYGIFNHRFLELPTFFTFSWYFYTDFKRQKKTQKRTRKSRRQVNLVQHQEITHTLNFINGNTHLTNGNTLLRHFCVKTLYYIEKKVNYHYIQSQKPI